MDKAQEIIDYVMNTPGNTNSAILRNKLNRLNNTENYYTKSETYSKKEVNELINYASETQKGTVRAWTTVEDGETVLNIATED